MPSEVTIGADRFEGLVRRIEELDSENRKLREEVDKLTMFKNAIMVIKGLIDDSH